MRFFISLIASIFAIIFFAVITFATSENISRPACPNFIIILVDDLGYADIGCYANSVVPKNAAANSSFHETLHIDSLAANGIRFTRGYAAGAVCSPTRAALQTGLNPARLGVTDWIRAKFQPQQNPTEYVTIPDSPISCPPVPTFLDPNAQTSLATILQRAGYATGHIGKWHLGREEQTPQHFGYGSNFAGCDLGQPPSYFDPYESTTPNYVISAESLPRRQTGEYLTDREADEAVAFIKRHRDQPFFLHLAHYAVHTPLQAKPEYVDYFKSKNPALSPQKITYAAMIRSVDDAVGKIVATLHAENLYDNTFIIFTSDNGGVENLANNAPLRSGKRSPYEGGIRVPYILAGGIVPHWRHGATCNYPIITQDIAPTLLELAAIKTPNNFDGRSFASQLAEEIEYAPRPLLWHFPHFSPERADKLPPYTVFQFGDEKLIRFYATNANYPQQYEFYNLANDPSEKQNIFSAETANRIAQLEELMNAELERLNAKMPRR